MRRPGPRLRHPAPEYVYLLGIYLDDGYIASHPRGVHKLRVTLDSKYPAIVSECESAMRAVAPGNAVRRRTRVYNDIEVYSYSKSWPCLLPQHGAGKKHHRSIALTPWQSALVGSNPQLLIRGLIQSDGCRFMNSGRGGWRAWRYRFDNHSPDIRSIFQKVCADLGLSPTTSGTVVYVSRIRDVARLDEWVGPKR